MNAGRRIGFGGPLLSPAEGVAGAAEARARGAAAAAACVSAAAGTAAGGGPGSGAGSGGRGPLSLSRASLMSLAAKAPLSLEILRPLKDLTSFRIGGPAALFARPRDLGELAAALAFARAEGIPHFILGGGANVLFDDQGLSGLVIRLSGKFRETRILDGDPASGEGAGRIHAGAGARLADVAALARRCGRIGFAALKGIPGTVGGALVMNAGAYGTEIGDRAAAVEILGREGGPGPQEGAPASGLAGAARVPRRRIRFFARGSDLEGRGTVLGAELLLGEEAPAEEILRAERETLLARRARLPQEPSAGSFFRNPEGQAAGRLIEECGLKGERVGLAQVSPRHANVIVNLGGATSADVRALADKVRGEVARLRGIELVPEVRVVSCRGEVLP